MFNTRKHPVRKGALVTGLALVVLGVGAGLAVAAPVTGSVSGQVTSVKGSSFVMRDAAGPVADSTVSLSGGSTIIDQVTAPRSDLKVGVCVTANGAKAAGGAIDAMQITISAAVKGVCSNGFAFGRGGGGPRPGGAPHAAGGTRPAGTHGNFNVGNFGFASGLVTTLKGSTLTVHGTTGTSSVALSSKTELSEMDKVSSSAITAHECASVRGTSSNEGLTVAATSVNLSAPTSAGCSRGFPGRGPAATG